MANTLGRTQSFKLIVHLFHEGDTELKYLQDFIKLKKPGQVIKLNRVKKVQHPSSLADEVIKWAKSFSLKSKEEIWVAFDDDGRDREVEEAFLKIKSSGQNINIAYMKPCIEIWPLMHLGKEGACSTQSKAQSLLSKEIPSYNHDGKPYFDIKKIDHGYINAVDKAKSWERSLCGDSEYNSSKFAGIYKLTEKIKIA